MSEVEYLDIPYFLRAPGAVGEDVKREFEKLKKRIEELETAVNSSYDAKTVATANEIVKNGWRCCVDHIIKPESKCPVCRIEELESDLEAADDTIVLRVQQITELEGRLKRLSNLHKFTNPYPLMNHNWTSADYIAEIQAMAGYANESLQSKNEYRTTIKVTK